MKPAYVLLATAAIFASAACNAENKTNASKPSAPIEAIKAPNGDWTKMVTATPEGGFLMGNPNADVKLVELGSMTCPHCAEFSEKADKVLIDEFVKSGRLSFEFRNFVRDGLDMTASLIARCGGTERFFPLTHALFADQRGWTGHLQDVPPEQLQALQTMGPERQFVEFAKISGLQQWAAQRGVPSGKSSTCLANQDEINKLVQINGDVAAQYPEFSGTPSFVLNGELLKQTSTWEALEPKLREALGS